MNTALPAMLHRFTAPVMNMMIFIWAPARRKAEKAVSYTHLDVYKRQTMAGRMATTTLNHMTHTSVLQKRRTK